MKYSQHKAVARYRGISYDLTPEEHAHLVQGPCIYCNGDSGGRIDRMDPKVGYTMANCVPACVRCNSRKAAFEHLGVEESIYRTLMLADRNKVPPPSKREWRAGFLRDLK